MCYAWMIGAAKMGMHFVGIGPEKLAREMDPEIVKTTFATARENGGLIEITDNLKDVKGADVIYGDIWASMGEEDLIPERAELLSPYRVTEEVLKAAGNPNVLYMHCLPSFHDFETKLAREWNDKGVDIREVTDEVFRGKHSVVLTKRRTGCTPSRPCWRPPSERNSWKRQGLFQERVYSYLHALASLAHWIAEKDVCRRACRRQT